MEISLYVFYESPSFYMPLRGRQSIEEQLRIRKLAFTLYIPKQNKNKLAFSIASVHSHFTILGLC